jgi:crotonobetainyl-CoA:carnitine CoA-transferase CaiB-like acyl-CoA transferase
MYANLIATSVVGHDLPMGWDRTKLSPMRTSFKTLDGHWIVDTNHPEEKYWPQFCDFLGRPELIVDDRFRTGQRRRENIGELYEIIDPIFETRTRENWLARAKEFGMFFAPVNSFADVLQDEQALQNEYIVEVEHGRLGTVKVPGYPIRFGKQRTRPYGEAPRLGEHTDEVLAGLGYSCEAIEAMRCKGSVS